MNKIRWEKVDGFDPIIPEQVDGWSGFQIKMPLGLPKLVLMPGDDALIPTGLWFPGLYEKFIIIPVHHTYPNSGSDICGVWKGKLRPNLPILHMSILTDHSHVYLHIINLGNTELKYGPGSTISYFQFVKLYNGDEEEDEDYSWG